MKPFLMVAGVKSPVLVGVFEFYVIFIDLSFCGPCFQKFVMLTMFLIGNIYGAVAIVIFQLQVRSKPKLRSMHIQPLYSNTATAL